MDYLRAFLCGGILCAVGQILIDKTPLTPARILTGYVVAGVLLTAVGIYMNFWFPGLPQWLSALVCLASITALNLVNVKAYGEAEFWMALIKIAAIVSMILLGLGLIFTNGQPFPENFSNIWENGGFLPNGLWGLALSIAVVMFSFGGIELIGITAGEAQGPQRTSPKAIKQIFWRILLFYVVCIFIIGTLVSYDDPRLLQAASSADIALSPFTLLYEKAGFAFAASLMNAVILTAILSAGNSGMYSSTRMLFDMARQGRAPKLFARLDPRGVPMNALYATTAIAALCFLTTFIGEQEVFNWLLNMSGMCGFIVWLGIAISHYRFRKGYLAQGYKLEDLAYKAKFFPFAPWFAFILCSIIILGQNYEALIGGKIDWLGLASTYISIPLFLAIWLGYKWKHKTKLIPYNEMDVQPMRIERDD